MNLPAVERIRMEQGEGPLPIPTDPLSIVRRRLFRGDSITAADVELEPARLASIVYNLRQFGFEFERLNKDDEVVWRCKNPDHEPTKKQHRHKLSKPRRLQDSPLLRYILAGHPITGHEAEGTFGVRGDSLRALIRRLELRGYKFSRTGMPPVYQLRSGPGVETVTVNDSGASPPAVIEPAIVRAPKGPSLPSAPPMHSLAPYPTLGSPMVVHMVAMTEDGDVQVGIRAESGESWLVRIEGYQAPS